MEDCYYSPIVSTWIASLSSFLIRSCCASCLFYYTILSFTFDPCDTQVVATMIIVNYSLYLSMYFWSMWYSSVIADMKMMEGRSRMRQSSVE